MSDTQETGGAGATQRAGKGELPGLVEAIVSGLGRRNAVEPVCRHPLPSEQTVIRILGLLHEVLFPGYFGRAALDPANLHFHIGETLNTVCDLLCQEISRCLMHEHKSPGPAAHGECEQEARRCTFALLRKLPDLREALDADVHAGYQGDPAATGTDEVIFCYPGFRAIITQRIAHELHLLGVRWLPRMMTEYAHSLTGIDIHPGAVIGRSFFIDHGTGVVIGETTEIGERVRLYQGVTLGAWSFRTDEKGDLVRGYKRHPTLEDDVIVYSNASILGPVTIGKGSIIGANVLLTHSVEAGSRVVSDMPKPQVRQGPEQ